MLYHRLVCVTYTLTLIVMAPLCLICCIIFWLTDYRNYKCEKLPKQLRRKILVTGDHATKAIHIIRALGKRGHTIIVADWLGIWSVLRWSCYVSKVYPVSPRNGNDANDYIKGVVDAAVKENIDWYLPISKKDYSVYDAQIGEYLTHVNPNIKCLASDPQLIASLDNKNSFLELCRGYKLSVPDFIFFSTFSDKNNNGTNSNSEKLSKNNNGTNSNSEKLSIFDYAESGVFENQYYFLKPSSCSSIYRSSFSRIPSNKKELKTFLQAYQDEHFFANQLVRGKEISANAICSNGVVLLSNLSNSSPIQCDYNVIERPKISKWVESFCKQSNYTGAICFDFIENDQGEIFCLECNPRFHSSLVTFLYHFNLEESLRKAFESKKNDFEEDRRLVTVESFEPNKDVFSYWFYQELFRVITFKRSVLEFCKILMSGYEALWDADDPVPYFIYHHFQMIYTLVEYFRTGDLWEEVNFCLGRVMY